MADELKAEFVRRIKDKVRELNETTIGQSTISVSPEAPRSYKQFDQALEILARVKTPVGPRYFSVKVTERC